MRAATATVAASNARRVLFFGQRRGIALATAPTLPAADHEGHARIPVGTMYALWAGLAHEAAVSSLPVQLAAESKLEDLGLLGLCIVTAPTFLAALETFVRFDPLLNQNRRFQVVVSGKQLELRLVSAEPLALGVRLSHETALAQAARAARQLCGAYVDPIQVSFRHAAPVELGAHRAHFRGELRFVAPHDRIVWSRALAAVRPPSANRAVWSYLCAQAERALQKLSTPLLHERVRTHLEQSASERSLRSGLQVTVVARSLGTTERSLRRALANEGTSFREICDALCKERAREALARGMPLGEAAFHAGFADTSAFSHACRRWFGMAPSALRRTLDAG